MDGAHKGSNTSSLTPDAFDKVGYDFAGSIAEVVAYDRGLSDGVRQKRRLSRPQVGLEVNALDSNHSYKNSKPAFGGDQIITFTNLGQAGRPGLPPSM